MSILVDDKPVEVIVRYIDRPYVGGAVGVKIFANKEEEKAWIEKENQRRSEKVMELQALKKEIPEKLKRDAAEDVKELVTQWKRTDWGTQTDIMNSATVVTETGETRTDWTKFRISQMKNLMIGWNLKTPDGKPIPINETILRRLDFNVALALIQKYEELTSPSDEELENLE